MKVVTYIRTSSNNQDLTSQKEEMEDFFEENPQIINFNFYIDEGVPGDLMNRPNYDKMIEDIKKENIKYIITPSASRFSRVSYLAGYFMTRLPQDVELLIANGAYGTYRKVTPSDFITAEEERYETMKRTRAGKLKKAKKGLFVGHIAPYGYTYINKSNRLEINNKESETVSLIFRLYTEKKMSMLKIASYLTCHGIKPRKYIKGKRESWGKTSISNILHNTAYYGEYRYNKTTRTNKNRIFQDFQDRKINSKRKKNDKFIIINVPAIISKETFDKAQNQITLNTVTNKRNDKHNYLLKGILYCGNCGSKMRGERSKGKWYYRCCSRDTIKVCSNKKACHKSMDAGLLDSHVWNSIISRIVILLNKSVINQRNYYESKSKIKELYRKKDNMHEQIDKLEKRRVKVKSSYYDGYISEAEFHGDMEKANTNIDKKLKTIAEMENGSILMQNCYSSQILNYDPRSMMEELINLQFLPYKERYELVRQIIDRVTVQGKDIIIELKEGIILPNNIHNMGDHIRNNGQIISKLKFDLHINIIPLNNESTVSKAEMSDYENYYLNEIMYGSAFDLSFKSPYCLTYGKFYDILI